MTTAELTIADSDGDGWFVLQGGTGWASVEGTAEEWRAIALGLLMGESVSYRRCAYDAARMELHSPRNAVGEHDCTKVADPAALAIEIRRVLGPRDLTGTG